MAEVMLYHHALGLTPGVVAFADRLRGAGHTVHTPDLFDGRIFDKVEKGMGFVKELGFGEVMDRGERAGRFSSIRACRSRSSGRRGPRAYRCRCMPWMPTRSLWMRATSTLLGRWSKKPRRRNSSSTPARSTCLPTARYLPTTRRLRPS